MKRLVAFALAGLLGVAAYAIDPQDFASPAEEARYRGLIEELRCLVCQNQNLADSDAALAKDLRDQVLEMIRAGRSDAEIKSYLVERYGDFVLYRPPVKPATWMLWFGPVLIVAVGAAVLVVTLRRRRRGTVAADPEQEELERRLDALEGDGP